MAIGDSFSVYLGTAATNRQPSSGVAEEISSVVKLATTDAAVMYDGTTVVEITANALISSEATDQSSSPAAGTNFCNLAIKSTNAVYLRKNGTTDTFGFSGVQVDA